MCVLFLVMNNGDPGNRLKQRRLVSSRRVTPAFTNMCN